METIDTIETGDRNVPADAEDGGSADGTKQRRSRRDALVRELRSRPFGYIVLGLFVVAGPILAPFIFPQAPPAVAVIGGLAFGAYAALCAVPQKFL